MSAFSSLTGTCFIRVVYDESESVNLPGLIIVLVLYSHVFTCN